MGARSIYEKTCPACAAVLGREAEHCPCGHHFTTPDAAQPMSDEELYEAYLAARVEQNLEALEHARAALRALPGDYLRAVRVLEQVHELRELQRELERQRPPVEAVQTPPATVDRGFTSPTEAFRVAQARRAEAIARRQGACSACGARIERGKTRCACGRDVPWTGDGRPAPIRPDSASDDTR